jgi:hypothetical protein
MTKTKGKAFSNGSYNVVKLEDIVEKSKHVNITKGLGKELGFSSDYALAGAVDNLIKSGYHKHKIPYYNGMDNRARVMTVLSKSNDYTEVSKYIYKTHKLRDRPTLFIDGQNNPPKKETDNVEEVISGLVVNSRKVQDVQKEDLIVGKIYTDQEGCTFMILRHGKDAGYDNSVPECLTIHGDIRPVPSSVKYYESDVYDHSNFITNLSPQLVKFASYNSLNEVLVNSDVYVRNISIRGSDKTLTEIKQHLQSELVSLEEEIKSIAHSLEHPDHTKTVILEMLNNKLQRNRAVADWLFKHESYNWERIS